MGLVGFLSMALPWFGKSFFNNKNAKDMLGKLDDLVESLTGKKKNYQAVLQDTQKLVAFQRHALAIYKSMNKDRENARRRDVMYIQRNKINSRANLMIYVASSALFGGIGMLWLCRNNLSLELAGIISAFIGIFGSCLKDAYMFEFGGSPDSRLERDSKI